MQKVKLPKHLDPFKSALQRSDYQGVVSARDMPRLQQSTAGVSEYIDVEVKFDIDAQGLTYFEGRIQGEVSLICQRCNHPFRQTLDTRFCFSPIKAGADTDELPDVYEPVEVNDHGEIDLLQVFEDELILALPIVAMHGDVDCNMSNANMSFGEIEPADERPNPFEVLKELKRNQE